MADPRYRAAAPDTLLVERLDLLTATFHRASGITHLLAEPAPEILDALAGGALTRGELLERLAAAYDLGEAAGLDARLEELVDAGLVEAVRHL